MNGANIEDLHMIFHEQRRWISKFSRFCLQICILALSGLVVACSNSNSTEKLPEVVDATKSHHANTSQQITINKTNNTGLYGKVQKSSIEQSADSYKNILQNKDIYVVKKGDTLYSIAFRYGYDYRELARRNGIPSPYNIAVGQQINISTEKAVNKTELAPPRSNSSTKTYTVKKGDTASSVAREHNIQLSTLIRNNKLNAPYTLKVGQKLNVTSEELYLPQTVSKEKSQETPPARAASTVAVAGKTQKTPTNTKDKETRIVKANTRKVAGITWCWPTNGNIIKPYSSGEQGNKGIDISGKSGQDIIASADGQVVYAGSALRGYGNLVIINHNSDFLSAYAHNDLLLVTEGEFVKRGQVIATMGKTDAQTTRLHFEIRKQGKSVNPQSYLPKK